MKKEYIIFISIILDSIMVSIASYLGSSFEYRSKLNVCEEIMREKTDVKSQKFKRLVTLCKREINLD